jgi:hypothetical protein
LELVNVHFQSIGVVGEAYIFIIRPALIVQGTYIFGSAKQVMLKRRCSVFSPATQPYIFNTTIFFNGLLRYFTEKQIILYSGKCNIHSCFNSFSSKQTNEKILYHRL